MIVKQTIEKKVLPISIPKEILVVERPKNTVVYVTYTGKKKIGCRYVNGESRPINGPMVGHTVGGKYVPTLLDWANAQLCESPFSDMMSELEKGYSHGEAMKLYAMAVLKGREGEYPAQKTFPSGRQVPLFLPRFHPFPEGGE